jgi:hypothetical protein
MIYYRATAKLVHCFFLEASLLEIPDILCCLDGVCTTITKNRSL